MLKNQYRLYEWICVAALAVFVVLMLVFSSGGTGKSVRELTAPVTKLSEATPLVERTAPEAAAAFGFDLTLTEGVLYYENEDIMNVSEILIVKVNDKSDAPEIKQAVERRVKEQAELYKNYAPDQYSLLQKSIVEVKGNTVFYCTGTNAGDVYDAFKKAL
ncbi:MAG: DUF4358 domain-containing protein [Clostridia bacterium]|nr:DUF4358 domain-containing protein [Clostridia bacterium]